MLTLLHTLHPLATRWGLALAMAASLLATPVAHAALTANADGTVTDSTTNLVWDQCAYGLTGATCASDSAFYGDWPGALAQASAANTAVYKGFSDWRVPNKNELESIVKRDTYSPAIDATAFPNTPTGDYFWTSTTYAPDPAGAWFVYFSYGDTDAVLKTNYDFVRLVRSGQSFAPFDVLLPVVNGSCGSAHATTPLVTTAPSGGALCTTGTATSVTSGTSAFTWSCTGTNSGSTASCSASRGYTVTASAGSNGSISPSGAQVVAHNATPAFTASPASSYAVNAWAGTCNGTPSGSGNVNYTSNAVTTDCTVSVSFSGTDATPDAFSFTAANGVALSTVQTSNTITVAGINTGAAISITGGEYQIGSGSFVSTGGTVNNGDTVTVRHTSSAAFSTATTTTLTIGGVSAQFVSTTGAVPPVNGSCGSAHATTPLVTSAPSINLCAAGTATSVTPGASAFTWSCTGANGGNTASCSASRGYTVTPSAGAGAGNGSISPSTPQVVAANATPAFTLTPNTGYAASATGCGGTLSVNTYTTAAITADCAVVASFTGNDSTPDAFSFTAANGVALSTVQASNSITVAGINTAANISITGGEYQIGSGAFTSTAGTVNNGNTVTVRHTSSGAHSTATTTTLTIGGVSANFVSTTVAPVVVNGACGSAANVASATAPAANLCSAGTAGSVTIGGTFWNWSCTGSNGGPTASCTAPFANTNGGNGTVGAIQAANTYGWQINTAVSGFIPLPAPAPDGVTMQGSATKVVLISGTPGTSTIVTLHFSSIPAGATMMYKYGKENAKDIASKWYPYPATIDPTAGTVTYTLTDGQKGDDDWTVNGVIADPVALAAPAVANGVTSVPTLSEWAMMALAALMALTTFVTMRRRMG